jgi:hypothetical protein
MTPRDSLQWYLDRLDQHLATDVAGHERQWAEQVGDLLGGLAQALRLHQQTTEAPGGLFATADMTRLSRRVSELCQEHQDFLERIASLRDEVRSAARAFQTESGPSVSPVPTPGKVGAVPDFSAIRREAQEIVDSLRKHTETETGLVLEGVTTDIGAGD